MKKHFQKLLTTSSFDDNMITSSIDDKRKEKRGV
jgi:hypothetical protein